MIRKVLHDFMVLNKLTAQDAADRCNVPVGTIQNILSGKSADPRIETCVMIARGLGISLDFLAGIEYAQKIVDDPTPIEQMPPIIQPPTVPVQPFCPHHADTVAMYEKTIAAQEKAIAERDKWIKSLLLVVSLLVVFIVSVLIFDLLHAGWGYFRT